MRTIALCFAVLCLLASASASASHAAARAAMTETLMIAHQQAGDVARSLLNSAQMQLTATHQIAAFHSDSSSFHAMAQPSATCAAALVQLNATVYTPGCLAFAGILSSLNNATLLNQEIAALCTSTCLSSLSAAVAVVVTSCASGDAAAFSAQISNLITTTNLVCTKDPNNPNNYCITQFYSAAQAVVGKTVLSNTDLQSFCTPCTTAILNGLSSYGSNAVNTTGINQLCSTDPNNGAYCLVELQNVQVIFATFNISHIPILTDAEFEPLCSPCAKRIALLAGLGTSTIDALCVMSGQDFCFVKAINNLNALQASIGSGNINTIALCQAFSSFVSTVGCCADALGALTNSLSAGGTGVPFKALFTLCNVADPGTCPMPTYTNSFTFIILNIAFSYYQQNTAVVTAAITADIAANLGLNTTQVTITSVVAATVNGSVSVGIKVTATITFNSALQSTSAVAEFTTNTKNGNFPLAAVAQLGPISRISPASPVTTSTTGASATTGSGGATSPAAPEAPFSSFVLVAAAFIVLLLNSNN